MIRNTPHHLMERRQLLSSLNRSTTFRSSPIYTVPKKLWWTTLLVVCMSRSVTASVAVLGGGSVAATRQRRLHPTSLQQHQHRRHPHRSVVPAGAWLYGSPAQRSSSSRRALEHEDPWALQLTSSVTTKTTATTTTLDHDHRGNGQSASSHHPDAYSYDDLTILGRIVAGVVEIGMTVAIEYVTGFCGGYVLGSVTDVPRLLTKGVGERGWKEMVGRTTRMNGKACQWAKNWGGISAAFGGFRVGVRVLRNGKEDEWTTVFSSMAAGAFFARAEGPQAMLRGAVLYGGLMYFLSGGMGAKKQPFAYDEEVVEF